MLIIQISGYKTYFYKPIDGTLMSIICKVLGGIITKIKAEKKSIESLKRSFNILDICKISFLMTFS